MTIATSDNRFSSHVAGTDAHRAIPIVLLGLSLSVFFAFSFTVCVIGWIFWPTGPVLHASLNIFLPGFTLGSWASYFLGLIECVFWGWYIAVLSGSIYNFFAHRLP